MTRGSEVGVWLAGVTTLTAFAAGLGVVAPAVAQEATDYRIGMTVGGVGLAPIGVAINSRTATVYVANPAAKDRAASLAILDATAGTLRRVLSPTTDMPNPTSVAVDSVSGRVFVANPQAADGNRLTVIDNDTITGSLPVGRMASWVRVDDTDTPRKVYVTNYGDSSRNVSGISIIHSTDAGAVLHASTAFSPSQGVTAVTVDTARHPHRVWAVNSNAGPHPAAGSLTAAESSADRATFTNWSGVLPAATTPGFAVVRPDTHTLYLADRVTDEVHVVDTSGPVPTPSNAFRTGRTIGRTPVTMSYDRVGDRLFVLYADASDPSADGELAVLDAADGTVLQLLTLPSPGGMALDPITGALWVTDTGHGRVHQVAESSSGVYGRAPSRPLPGDPIERRPAPPSGAGTGPTTAPARQEQPAWNSRGEPCGAIMSGPRC